MTFDADSGLHDLHVADHDQHRRAVRVHQLGLDAVALPEFDELATDLGQRSGQPWAMVNIFRDKQSFIGLYVASGFEPVPRTMSRDHGYCPDLMHRSLALVLPDVCAHPRFQSNAVVDLLGVRTYSGAPLIHRQDHRDEPPLTLGTVCFIGPDQLPDSSGRPNLALIKNARDEATALINDRARALAR